MLGDWWLSTHDRAPFCMSAPLVLLLAVVSERFRHSLMKRIVKSAVFWVPAFIIKLANLQDHCALNICDFRIVATGSSALAFAPLFSFTSVKNVLLLSALNDSPAMEAVN